MALAVITRNGRTVTLTTDPAADLEVTVAWISEQDRAVRESVPGCSAFVPCVAGSVRVTEIEQIVEVSDDA